jgi:carboxyl-terminal processing protease
LEDQNDQHVLDPEPGGPVSGPTLEGPGTDPPSVPPTPPAETQPRQSPPDRGRGFWISRSSFVTVAVLILAVGFLLGAGLGVSSGFRSALRSALPASLAKSVLGTDQLFPLQQEVLDQLDKNFYQKFSNSSLEDAAVRGMVSGLNDPYTTYFSPQDYATFQEHTSGSYVGVGMEVEMNGHFVQVVTAFKGTPAEAAGVKPGDILLAVDKQPIDGLTLQEVVAKIKGPAGTKVTLDIYHMPATSTNAGGSKQTLTDLPSGGESVEMSIERKAIDVPVVSSEIKTAGTKKVAYITFSTFSQGSAKKLREAVATAVQQDHVDAVVLDLRNNGGGLLTEAVDVASIFIPQGVIVTTDGLHSPKQVFNATGNAFADVPVYVLVNSFSASASEIVAGALKDTKRATLVGETTFGKGLVQDVLGLSNGGALKVTIAVYLTPSGTDINKKGITPNVVVTVDPNAQGDPVLDKALGLAANGS